MRIIILLSIFASVQTYAQTVKTEFPADATSPTAAVLNERVSGKVFYVALDNGRSWNWKFGVAGDFSLDTSDGFSDTGKWTVQDGKLCTEGKKIKASCNDVREQGASLHLKRDNGTVVEMRVK